MPSWDFVRDNVLPMLMYMVLPALASGAVVMAVVTWIGGAKQAAAGAALGVCVGAVIGLWFRDAAPQMKTDVWAALGSVTHVLTLVPGTSEWNRLPWAILASVCVGRLANLADVHASDGWLLRGGASIAIAWLLLPESLRDNYYWIAPGFAFVIWAHWAILNRLATQPASSSVAVSMFLTTLVSAQLMVHAHSARFMDALAVLAFAFAGVCLIAFRRGIEFGGAIPALALAVPSVLLMGKHQTDTEMPWTTFALPACMPFVLATTLPFAHWPRWRVHVIRLVLVLALLGATVALAQLAAPIDFTEQKDDWN